MLYIIIGMLIIGIIGIIGIGVFKIRTYQKKDDIQKLYQENQYLREQLNEINTINSLQITNDELESAIAAAKIRVAELDGQINDRTRELNNVAAQFKELHDQSTKAMAENTAAAMELQNYKNELITIVKELDDAKTTQRNLILGDNGDRLKNYFDLGGLSSKETKLISTLAEISELYPELMKDLATIEWKKIWLPKFQNICNANGLNGTRGIYRLILKSDNSVCYVGQAINIKERWYEHVKKMIGADTKGNEKLYKYRPEDFYWTVLETGTSDLNKAEKYWIEFYCCKEVGLNLRQL